MSSILTLPDLMGAHLRKVSAQARSLYKHSIRPIYRALKDGRPECMGSAILLEVDGVCYLATAAHVLDEPKPTSLHLGGYPKLIPLNADFSATVKSGGNESVDVAVARVSQDIFAGLGGLPFIAQADQVTAPGATAGRTCLAMGYPHTKNKTPWWQITNLKPTILTCLSTVVPVPKGATRFEGGSYNFALDLGKFGKRDGKKVKVPKLNGVSGGGVLDLGPLPTLEQLASETAFRPKLAGLVIERADKALICTEMSAVYACIDHLEKRASSG